MDGAKHTQSQVAEYMAVPCPCERLQSAGQTKGTDKSVNPWTCRPVSGTSGLKPPFTPKFRPHNG